MSIYAISRSNRLENIRHARPVAIAENHNASGSHTGDDGFLMSAIPSSSSAG
jgi:hypothetical protein